MLKLEEYLLIQLVMICIGDASATLDSKFLDLFIINDLHLHFRYSLLKSSDVVDILMIPKMFMW